jgi:ribosomal protein S27E
MLVDGNLMRLALLLVVWVCMCHFLFVAGATALSTIVPPCRAQYKVYVYAINHTLHTHAEAARTHFTYHICRKCIFEQFSLEYIMYDYFTSFCGRTHNPEEADLFYLPIVRDVDYRIALGTGGGRASSPIENALIDAIEKNSTQVWKDVFNVTDYYWNRRHGADHVCTYLLPVYWLAVNDVCSRSAQIIVMPAPVTNLRHQSGMRGFFHYVRCMNCQRLLSVCTSHVTRALLCWNCR